MTEYVMVKTIINKLKEVYPESYLKEYQCVYKHLYKITYSQYNLMLDDDILDNFNLFELRDLITLYIVNIPTPYGGGKPEEHLLRIFNATLNYIKERIAEVTRDGNSSVDLAKTVNILTQENAKLKAQLDSVKIAIQ